MRSTTISSAAARLRSTAGAMTAALLATALLAPASSASANAAAAPDDGRADRPAVSKAKPATAKKAQVLKWTADNNVNAYKSAPKTAKAGPTTIVFENSKATGNTSGMQHTLTFDTTSEGYNHDVDLNIKAYPGDKNNGKWKANVVLTKGKYRYHCVIPGHGQMQGVLVVKGGGDPGNDTTPPKASVKLKGEKNGNGAFVGNATASLTATDGGSGVKSIEYRIDDTSWKKYSNPVKVTAVGSHTISYRATDKAGNTSKVKTKAFKVVKDDGKDTAPPKVSAMLHGKTNAGGAYVGSAEVMLNASDSESGVAKVEYKLDGAAWKAYKKPFKVSKNGDHVVRYRATDKAGNTSKAKKKAFKVVPGSDEDQKAPKVSATVSGKQSADWSYTGAVSVKLKASDAGSGVKKVQYRLDDDKWQAYKKAVKVEETGAHTVDYRATDAAGNTSKAKTVGFTIAEKTPAPECAEPDPSPTVVIGDIGTGVHNRRADSPCTIDDLIHDEARWSSHSGFVDHVKRVVGNLSDNGIVSPGERRKILGAAQQSNVGR